MTRTAFSQRGFTLVELLVVVAIIGVLMGLLLPAVQGAREAGRRVTCTNNQYQLALGMSRFNDSNGFMPGWRNSLPTISPTPSWPIMAMPFIERNDVYRAVATGALVLSSTSLPYISLFICPSSPPDNPSNALLAYAGNCGSASNTRRFDGVMQDTTITSGSTSGRVALDDISNGDGAANTLILSEKCLSGTAGLVMGVYAGAATGGTSFAFSNSGIPGSADASSYTPGFGLIGSSPGSSKVINPAVLGSGTTSIGQVNVPSSNHPGGVVVAFCDGHTGFLRDSLLPRVYAQLLSWSHRNATTTAGGLPTSTAYMNWNPSTVLDESDFQ